MESFKLPVSSYDEIIKVIKAYGNGKPGVSVSLDELVKSSGISKFILSKNNGFLIQIGLITKGNRKSPTEKCKKLASAYSMNISEEILNIWKEIFYGDEFITSMASMVSVKNRISRDEFINHIVFSADCGNSTAYKTGAATVIEIMKLVEMISEKDGYITIRDDTAPHIAKGKGKENIGQETLAAGGNRFAEEKQPIVKETTYFVQPYTCESGEIAKVMIPNNATEDDLLGLREMLDIVLKRKFKINLKN